jgi:hypothetical protein
VSSISMNAVNQSWCIRNEKRYRSF